MKFQVGDILVDKTSWLEGRSLGVCYVFKIHKETVLLYCPCMKPRWNKVHHSFTKENIARWIKEGAFEYYPRKDDK